MISLLPEWPNYDKEEINAAIEVLESSKVNYWTGSNCKEFESEFSDIIGCKYSICHSNGTVALISALIALGIGIGDEVITTPRTFIASSSALVLLGAKPIFADVDNDSGLITPKTIEPLINKKTKAILVVHLAGWPAEMQSICELAKSKKLKVIEDCSQSHGALIEGKSVGSFGDISAWSFCQDKIITTGGEGGMVSTSSKDLFDKVWSYKDHGKSKKLALETNHPPGFRWLHEDFGSNFRLTEFQAAIGRIQISKLKNWQKIRKKNAMIIADCLKDLNNLRVPLPPKDKEHAWYKFYTYIVTSSLSSEWNRDRIISEINSKHYPAFSGSCSEIYLENCFQRNNLAPKKRLPFAKKLGEESLMFLVHPTISTEDMIKYTEVIYEVLKKSTR